MRNWEFKEHAIAKRKIIILYEFSKYESQAGDKTKIRRKTVQLTKIQSVHVVIISKKRVSIYFINNVVK